MTYRYPSCAHAYPETRAQGPRTGVTFRESTRRLDETDDLVVRGRILTFCESLSDLIVKGRVKSRYTDISPGSFKGGSGGISWYASRSSGFSPYA